MTATSNRPKARAAESELLDTAAVVEIVRKAREAGDLKDKVAPSQVSDVINGRRDPGPKLLEAIGLRRVCGYQRVKR